MYTTNGLGIENIWLKTKNMIVYLGRLIIVQYVFNQWCSKVRIFMNKSIVIAEKPSVGRDIARVLGCHNKNKNYIEGPKYIVTWAMGHLVTLADPVKYGPKYEKWEMSTLPMIPERFKLELIGKTSFQFKVIKQLLHRKDVSEIIIATDAGREGELVARWILEYANVHKKVKRLWISSVTDQAIREGFTNLKDGNAYISLYKSAIARAESDWLIGLNASRALTCKYNASLSCGRVQTPTLGMVATRENIIKNFKSKALFSIEIKVNQFIFMWCNQSMQPKHSENQEMIKQVIMSIKDKPLQIKDISKKVKKSYSAGLYDLTELQRDANRLFDFSAKETLRTMQNLYERHKILTYPRTDSKYLTTDIVPTLHERLKAIQVGPYKKYVTPLLHKPIKGHSSYVNNNKVTDHHAIIPTEEYVDLSALSGSERKIYDLVIKRFLSVLYPPHVYEHISITAQIGEHKFICQEKITTTLGYKELFEESHQVVTKSNFVKNASITNRVIKESIMHTTPPARLTEGTLLAAMENPKKYMLIEDDQLKKTLDVTGGLGTVATRADIIEKLYNHQYIEKKGKSLWTTKKGRQLLELAPEALRSPDLTAQWEVKLQAIAKGKLKKEVFINELITYTKNIVKTIKASELTYRHDNLSSQNCPECGKLLLNIENKHGKSLVCQDRGCGYRKNVSKLTNSRCPVCHKKMELVGEGDSKQFVCKCGHRERLSAFNEKRKEYKKQMNKREASNYIKKQSKSSEEFNNPFASLLGQIKD